MDTEFEAIVIGSGCAGGWAAKELAEGGAKVLVLEAGRTLLRDELLHVPLDCPLGGMGPENTAMLYADPDKNPYTFPPEKPFNWVRSRQVGGRSVLWGGISLRYSDYEFKAGERDGASDSWPIAHEDLSPYYDKVEAFLGVEGTTEGLPQLPDGRFVGAAPLSEAETEFGRAVRVRWGDRHLVPARGISLTTRGADDWPRSSSQGSTLFAAHQTGNLTLRSNAVVHRIEYDRDANRAGRVLFFDAESGSEHAATARVVVLAASTIESTRILLNSACDDFPSGLGDASGTLGHYLMDHPTLGLVGRVPGRAQEPVIADWARCACMPRFRNLDSDSKAAYHRGYGILGFAGRTGIALPEDLAAEDGAHFAFFALGEMLPRSANRVSLSPTEKDAWGIPCAHIEMEWEENEKLLTEDARAELRAMLEHCGWEVTGNEEFQPGTNVHEMGTARMGDHPDHSYLNSKAQCWALPNLFVVDGAAFPTGGWQNPTLTMMAVAARSSRIILDALRDGAF